ncbi:uncharacterized protein KNAG_0I01240 [Huiozyma naganishii CBS 8797]|uniref:Uncharacterized protein n=1 Tax=Huiozyma naganishii (strain ATCC MYA-139 / BCRC 22969 / CBS 8797 / KCTC 17520 / NBRC 10181 / NCYC 3082 / Yp74L-3) TaxID=1071383 RepID=J7RAL0_HUIN7|nr:hypothetical protein KNAG_0I01240 [Kazachstania naganishii CBS 8797]CCK71915.1 hypothetical protein KNAG_0I01240 [Kazachstania naganishii CBS 8797]
MNSHGEQDPIQHGSSLPVTADQQASTINDPRAMNTSDSSSAINKQASTAQNSDALAHHLGNLNIDSDSSNLTSTPPTEHVANVSNDPNMAGSSNDGSHVTPPLGHVPPQFTPTGINNIPNPGHSSQNIPYPPYNYVPPAPYVQYPYQQQQAYSAYGPSASVLSVQIPDPNIPNALNPTSPNSLSFITSATGFDLWIQQLINHLRNKGYADLVPDKFGTTKRYATDGEELGITWLFTHYVKKEYYPNWIPTMKGSDLSEYDIIQTAMTKHIQKHDPGQTAWEISQLTFGPSEPAITFIGRVRRLVRYLPPDMTPLLDTLIKNGILVALKDPIQQYLLAYVWLVQRQS